MTRIPSAQWTLQDAKARFSEVVRRAMERGPQYVTRSGAEAVVILSARDFAKLAPTGRHSLAQFLAASPLGDVELDIARPSGSGRQVKL